jgi:oligosaccharide translocation protein RFT1
VSRCILCECHFACGVIIKHAFFDFRAMAQLKTSVRVRAEGLGVTGKSILTVAVLAYDDGRLNGKGDLGLLAFALGQLTYASCVLATYSHYYGVTSFWPTKLTDSRRYVTNFAGWMVQLMNEISRLPTYFEPEMFRLSLTMTSQSLVKHLLTEGDKLILSRFSPLQDQGGYAIAVNYGSPFPRIILSPIFICFVSSRFSRSTRSLPTY